MAAKIRVILERTIVLAFGSAFILLGINNTYHAALSWRDFLDVEKYWSMEPATIREIKPPGRLKWNEPYIRYDFEAKGKKFTGSRIDIFDFGHGRKGINQFLRDYTVGEKVLIYCDIRDPSRSVFLKPAFSWWGMIITPLGNLFAVLPMGLWFFKKSLRTDTPTRKPAAALTPITHYHLNTDLKIVETGTVTLPQALDILNQRITDCSLLTCSDAETVISKSTFGFSRGVGTFLEIAIMDANNFDVRVELEGTDIQIELQSISLARLTGIVKKFFTSKPEVFGESLCSGLRSCDL